MSIVPIHRRGANVAAEGAAPKHRRRDAAEPSNRRRQVPILLRLPDLTDEAEPFASATRDKATPDRDTPDWATVEPDDISHSGAAADHAPLRDANIDPPTIDDSEFDEIDSDSASGHLTSRATPASSRPSFAPVRVDRPGRGARSPVPSPATQTNDSPTNGPPATKKPFAVKRQQLVTRREDTPKRWWFEPMYLVAAIVAVGAIIIAGCWLMRKTASLPTHVATPPLWNGVLPGQATPNSPLAGQAPDDSQYPAARAAAAPAGRSADGEPTPDGSYGNAGSYRAANRNDREPELNYRSESNYRTAERTPAGPPTTYGPGSIAPQSARPPYEPRRAAPANDSRQPATPYFWPPTAPNQAPMPAPQAPMPGSDETTDTGAPGTARLMGTIDPPTMRAQNERIGSGVY